MRKKMIIITMILILLLLILFFYFKDMNERNNVDPPKEDDTIIQIPITDEKANEMYNSLYDNKFYILTNDLRTIYQDKVITFNSQIEKDIIMNALRYLLSNNPGKYQFKTIEVNGAIKFIYDNQIDNYVNGCEIRNMNFEELTDKTDDCYIPLYIEKNETLGSYTTLCDDYECNWTPFGINKTDLQNKYKLVKVEKNTTKDEYYLYDEVYYSDGINLYDSYTKNNIIYTSTNNDEINYNFVKENYGNNIFIYKHTYKAKNNGYYWYQTELVK